VINCGNFVPPSTSGSTCGKNGLVGVPAPGAAPVAVSSATLVPVNALLKVIVNGPPLVPVTSKFPLKVKATPVAVAVAWSERVTEVALGTVAMTAPTGMPTPTTGMPMARPTVEEMLVMVTLPFVVLPVKEMPPRPGIVFNAASTFAALVLVLLVNVTVAAAPACVSVIGVLAAPPSVSN